jgi:hypothetical protein
MPLRFSSPNETSTHRNLVDAVEQWLANTGDVADSEGRSRKQRFAIFYRQRTQ